MRFIAHNVAVIKGIISECSDVKWIGFEPYGAKIERSFIVDI